VNRDATAPHAAPPTGLAWSEDAPSGTSLALHAALLVSLLAMGARGTTTFEILLVGAAIVLLGVPHGAADARLLLRRFEAERRLLAFATYAGLALAVGLAWWLAPSPVTIALLLASAWHFGENDARIAPMSTAVGLEAVVRGLLAVSAPLVGAPDQSAPLLALLLPSDSVAGIAAALQSLRPLPWIALGALLALTIARPRPGRALGRLARWSEPILILTSGLLLPPLWAFAAYFCLWHAPRHVGWLAEIEHTSRLHVARDGLRWTLLAAVGVSGLAVAFAGVERPTDTALRALLLGLLALTVPHMILVHRTAQSEASDPAVRRGAPPAADGLR
jgi:Brp/Blh family beta-carotene 15,15'-monooxygenase